jgi:hypothetical protein
VSLGYGAALFIVGVLWLLFDDARRDEEELSHASRTAWFSGPWAVRQHDKDNDLEATKRDIVN